MSGENRASALGRVKRAAELFCAALLFLAVAINMAEIVVRVVFRQSLDLLFDLPVWITVWAMLLITGFLLPENGHVAIDFLRVKIRGGPRRALEVALALVTLAFGAFLTWSGVLFVQHLIQRQSVYPRSIPIPAWIVQLCVPVGMGLFTMFALAALASAIRRRG
jgi:TRAP-type C4-dicarboxylate transport system permease small subunit